MDQLILKTKAEYKRDWYLNNRARLLQKAKAYREANQDKIKLYRALITPQQRAKYRSLQDKEAKAAYMKKCRLKNKPSIRRHQNLYRQKKTKIDLSYRLANVLRRRLNHALKGNVKKGSAVKDLGCTIPELIHHLESKFKPGMTWSNYGFNGWHIDHIIPLCKFDLTDVIQLKKACHFSNLQPLWKEENLKKGGRE